MQEKKPLVLQLWMHFGAPVRLPGSRTAHAIDGDTLIIFTGDISKITEI